MDYVAIVSAASSIASVGVAWVAYKVSRSALRAAEVSTASAERLTAIEQRREWAEHLPQFEVSLVGSNPADQKIRIELVGPPTLDRLDSVTVSIRDDRLRDASPIAGGPTKEDVAKYVWGPYRFRHGVDGATADGRSVKPFPLPLGESWLLALDPTLRPPWVPAESGFWNYQGKPVRLTLHCSRDGFEPWVIPIEIPTSKVPHVTSPELPRFSQP